MLLHPPLTGMPVAFAVLTLFLEGWQLIRPNPEVRKARSISVFFLVGSTVAAFLSGYHATANMGDQPPAAQEAVAVHHLVSKLTLVAALLCGAFYALFPYALHGKKFVLWSYRFFLIVLTVLLLRVGFLGGDLVFFHGVGVSPGTHKNSGSPPPGSLE